MSAASFVQRASLHWSARYVGQPWRQDAEGPDAWDCKGLVRHVQRAHYGREVPRLLHAGRLTDWAQVRASVQHEGWRRVPVDARSPAQDGDILLVHRSDGPHVGVIVKPMRGLRLLHAVGSPASPGEVWCHDLGEALVFGGFARPEYWRYVTGEGAQ